MITDAGDSITGSVPSYYVYIDERSVSSARYSILYQSLRSGYSENIDYKEYYGEQYFRQRYLPYSPSPQTNKQPYLQYSLVFMVDDRLHNTSTHTTRAGARIVSRRSLLPSGWGERRIGSLRSLLASARYVLDVQQIVALYFYDLFRLA